MGSADKDYIVMIPKKPNPGLSENRIPPKSSDQNLSYEHCTFRVQPMFIDFGSTRANLGPQLLTERLVQLDKDFQNAYLGGYMGPTMFNHRMGIKL